MTWFMRRRKTKKVNISKPLKSSRRIIIDSFWLIVKSWRLVLPLMAIYAALNIAFGSGLRDLYNSFNAISGQLTGHGRTIANGLKAYGNLLSSAGSSKTQIGLTLEMVVVVLFSLIIIWTIRQLMAGKPTPLANVFYKSTNQLVPFVMVLAILMVSLLPLSLGLAIVDNLLSSNIEIWGIIIFGILAAVLIFASFFLFLSSFLGLYIVTLPDMRPIAAIRAANNLVRFRRLSVSRRLIILSLFPFLVMGLITLPLNLYLHVAAVPTFFGLILLSLLWFHVNFYNLYRSLLK